MLRAELRVCARFGHVDRFASKLLLLLNFLHFAVHRVQLLCDLLSNSIDHLAGLRAFLGGELAHRAAQKRQFALLAQQLEAQRIQIGFAFNGSKLCSSVFLDFAKLFLHIHVVLLLIITKKKAPSAKFISYAPKRIVRPLTG